ncbi:hypothetical protein DOTSEDRAFT_174288 [Dothistroma septosporum NZE10]|uniref:Suppressor of anucleate metulae protein B n=1 Tax=Dothistroma septosporum (strain NZE10 / CBS 128990) TaxID=675120 RepID=M2XLY2_DOTSN|nr:hypothetical protein DOTSEDRAFT_174288 [Dothistroma septosporum NZE10]
MPPETCAVCGTSAPHPLLIRQCCYSRSSPSPPISSYCSTTCKKSDTSQHSRSCYRRRIHRAAELLRATFLRLREVGFEQKIQKIERLGDVVHFTEEAYQEDMRTTTEGPLFPFPDHLIQNGEDKAKILTYNACSDALGYLIEFGEALLGELATKFEELDFTLKECHRKTIRYTCLGHESVSVQHSVLIFLGHDAQDYVLDLAGAQFGQNRAVVPLKEYMDTYLDPARNQMVRPLPRGSNAEALRAIRDGDRDHEHGVQDDVRVYEVHHMMDVAILQGVRRWERKEGMKASELLSCEESAWGRGKASLLERINEAMRECMFEWRVGRCKLKYQVGTKATTMSFR